jgi:hypothetical protein
MTKKKKTLSILALPTVIISRDMHASNPQLAAFFSTICAGPSGLGVSPAKKTVTPIQDWTEL